MTTVSIFPIPSTGGPIEYHAVAGEHRSTGKSAGQALDALSSQFSAEELRTLIIVQHMQPDKLFSAAQQLRLDQLMRRWRAARDSGGALPVVEQDELDQLIESELRAAGQRAVEIQDKLMT